MQKFGFNKVAKHWSKIWIKNEKFSRYNFYMNPNMYRGYQIYISVSLNLRENSKGEFLHPINIFYDVIYKRVNLS